MQTMGAASSVAVARLTTPIADHDDRSDLYRAQLALRRPPLPPVAPVPPSAQAAEYVPPRPETRSGVRPSASRGRRGALTSAPAVLMEGRELNPQDDVSVTETDADMGTEIPDALSDSMDDTPPGRLPRSADVSSADMADSEHTRSARRLPPPPPPPLARPGEARPVRGGVRVQVKGAVATGTMPPSPRAAAAARQSLLRAAVQQQAKKAAKAVAAAAGPPPRRPAVLLGPREQSRTADSRSPPPLVHTVSEAARRQHGLTSPVAARPAVARHSSIGPDGSPSKMTEPPVLDDLEVMSEYADTDFEMSRADLEIPSDCMSPLSPGRTLDMPQVGAEVSLPPVVVSHTRGAEVFDETDRSIRKIPAQHLIGLLAAPPGRHHRMPSENTLDGELMMRSLDAELEASAIPHVESETMLGISPCVLALVVVFLSDRLQCARAVRR
jgi:hypothetical protein